ncbi:MAG TPA: phosphoribosylanthranilate isomerase [Bryobacteraceae bacterium]|nr:phosphoribosylanthranilate isomerase [Bryobacteraceae bacterium]
MMVKICGITRRKDALAAAEAGASALGFIFYEKSPRYVTPPAAAKLGEGLEILKVGVFVGESPAAMEAAMCEAQLDVAQIYGGDWPENVRVWRAFRPGDGIAAGRAEAILLDGPANGISFDWTTARAAGPRVIVAGGLDASNVAEAIRIARPWGVDASSKLETSPGIKDHEKVRAFIKAAREAK